MLESALPAITSPKSAQKNHTKKNTNPSNRFPLGNVKYPTPAMKKFNTCPNQYTFSLH